MDTRLKKYLFLAFACLALIAVLALVSGNASADTHTWISDGAANSDSGAAWDTATAPEAADDLVFNSAHTGTCTINQALTFGTITVGASSGTVTQGAVDFGYSDFTMAGGTWNGVITNVQTCSGNFTCTAGNIGYSILRLKMMGATASWSIADTMKNCPFHLLWITGNTTIHPGGTYSTIERLQIDSGASLSISLNQYLRHNYYLTTPASTYVNSGVIAGAGEYRLYLMNENKAIAPGHVTVAIFHFYATGSMDASRTYSLSGDALSITSAIQVDCPHASFTVTLNLAGYQLSATTITVSTRGIISSSVAGAKLTTSGAITVSANGQLDATNIAWINCGTNWDSSAGTWTHGTNQVNMTGTGTTKIAAGQTFYNLFAANGGTTRTLLSNVVVTNHKRLDGTLAQGAYTVTISGSNAKPLEINGTTSGIIAITSSAASYTVYTNLAMGAGSVSVTKECTFIFTGGQVTVTPDSGTANISMKSWTWESPGYYSLYVGETVGGANVSFVLSTLQLNGRYDLYLDHVFVSTWIADGYGDLYFYHATWSGHLVELRWMLVITSGAPATTVNEYVPYYYNGTADEAGTWSLVTAHSWMTLNPTTGKITGTPDYSDVAVETVSLRITNINGTAYLNWTLTVANVATVWVDDSPPLTAHQLGIWTYDFNCTQEGVSVVYSMVCSVPDLAIDSTTGVVSGKLMGDVDVTITVTADDQAGSVITHSFIILVSPPDFEGTWGPMIVSLGALMLLIAFMVIMLNGIKMKKV